MVHLFTVIQTAANKISEAVGGQQACFSFLGVEQELTPLPLGEIRVSRRVVEVPAVHGLSTSMEVVREHQRCERK